MSANERLVAPVPVSTYAQPGIATGQRWVAHFNVSCWVRCRTGEATEIRLLLRVRDGSGKDRDFHVDRAVCARDGTLLLSALTEVAVTGRIEEMTVWLLSEPPAQTVVDELFVQRAGATAVSRPIISSR